MGHWCDHLHAPLWDRSVLTCLGSGSKSWLLRSAQCRVCEPSLCTCECLQTCPGHVLQSTIVMALLEIVDGSRSALRISNPPKHIFHHRFSHLDVSFCGDHEYVLTAPFSGSSDPEILQRVRTGQYSFPEKHFAKVSRQAKVGTQ